MATLAIAVAAAPPAAQASFTVAPCGGSAIQGEGSSLQKVAQQSFWASTSVFYGSFGCGSGALSSSPITYNPDGSGCGIASIGGGPTSAECSDFNKKGEAPVGNGYRDPVTRFAGSDAPLTPAQKAAAEDAGGPKPGIVHQLPVAAAAVAVIVHFPEGCELKDPGTGIAASGVGSVNDNVSTGGVNDPTGAGTGDTLADETLRVHISAAELETIWDGTPQTWGNIVPEADFRVTVHTAKECAETPVMRIVRFDGSGTTYNFKAYLGLLPAAPSGLWTSAPVVGDNNIWPETENGTKQQPSKVNGATHVCESVNHICTAAAGGGGELASAVEKTDGAIGYVDLSTARQKGFDVTKKTDDHTYWVPLQTINPAEGDKVGTHYVEPTASPTAHVNGGPSPLGANCTNADYRGIPTAPASDPTLGDWSSAIATGSTDAATYPDCALTYDFAFDDNAPVYGNTQPEQLKARTVKDYLEAVESNAGQFGLASADYGTLPLNIVQLAQNGVKAIDWNKAAGAGGGGGGGTVTPPPITTPGATTPGVTVTTPPSNSFSIASGKIKGKSIVLSLVLPGAGQLQIKATGGGVTVSNVTASTGGGQGTVTLPISSAALKKLAKSKSKKLSVTITVTFTPTGGTAATQKKTLTVTQASIAGKGKKKKGKKKG
jgi:ABC-type phosphate transport system substrate-binding protein